MSVVILDVIYWKVIPTSKGRRRSLCFKNQEY